MSWFLLKDDAKTTPILRFAQEQALRVKPMLDWLRWKMKPFLHKVKTDIIFLSQRRKTAIRRVIRIKIKNKLKIRVARDKSNKCFNLINPLSWFLLEDHAKTTPSLRSSSGADLKVKRNVRPTEIRYSHWRSLNG